MGTVIGTGSGDDDRHGRGHASVQPAGGWAREGDGDRVGGLSAGLGGHRVDGNDLAAHPFGRCGARSRELRVAMTPVVVLRLPGG
jgi:hypothetical protein